MSEHKRSDCWDHTAAVRMQIAAANARRGQPIRLDHFHPFMQRAKPTKTTKPLDRQQGAKLLDSVFGIAPEAATPATPATPRRVIWERKQPASAPGISVT